MIVHVDDGAFIDGEGEAVGEPVQDGGLAHEHVVDQHLHDATPAFSAGRVHVEGPGAAGAHGVGELESMTALTTWTTPL